MIISISDSNIILNCIPTMMMIVSEGRPKKDKLSTGGLQNTIKLQTVILIYKSHRSRLMSEKNNLGIGQSMINVE